MSPPVTPASPPHLKILLTVSQKTESLRRVRSRLASRRRRAHERATRRGDPNPRSLVSKGGRCCDQCSDLLPHSQVLASKNPLRLRQQPRRPSKGDLSLLRTAHGTDHFRRMDLSAATGQAVTLPYA